MLPIFLIGFSFGALLILFVNVIADYSDKRAAREAFYEGDYRTCYQNLFGKKLDETESIMYGKSRSILYIRLWLREYEMFVEEGSELQALDSLIQTVDSYPELYEYAGSWNATEEVAAGYATVLNILADKYGLSESDAKAIAGERSNVEYTRKVTAVVEGKYQGSGNSSESSNGHGTAADNPAENPENSSDEVLPDLLPEEDGLGQDNFLDNE